MERHNESPCRAFRCAYAADRSGVQRRDCLNMPPLLISLQLVLEDAAATKSRTLEAGR